MKKRPRRPGSVVGVADLKARLSLYLDRVRSGREVVVTEHGHPVARLVPVPPGNGGDQRRDRLVRQGILDPARRRPDVRAWLTPSPLKDPGGEVRRLLIEDRDRER